MDRDNSSIKVPGNHGRDRRLANLQNLSIACGSSPRKVDEESVSDRLDVYSNRTNGPIVSKVPALLNEP